MTSTEQLIPRPQQEESLPVAVASLPNPSDNPVLLLIRKQVDIANVSGFGKYDTPLGLAIFIIPTIFIATSDLNRVDNHNMFPARTGEIVLGLICAVICGILTSPSSRSVWRAILVAIVASLGMFWARMEYLKRVNVFFTQEAIIPMLFGAIPAFLLYHYLYAEPSDEEV